MKWLPFILICGALGVGIIALLNNVVATTLILPQTTFENLTVNGDIFIRGDILTVTDIELNGTFLPAIDNFFDIGSASMRWRDGFFSGNLIVEGNLTSNCGAIFGDNGSCAIITNCAGEIGLVVC